MANRDLLTPSNDEWESWHLHPVTEWFFSEIKRLKDNMTGKPIVDLESMENTFGMCAKREGYLDSIEDIRGIDPQNK